MIEIRDRLVANALEWQKRFGVAPHITSAISEFDAAMLLGMTETEYSTFMQSQTAVQRGHDFIYKGVKYQVKANRPSGKPGSKVTLVPKASNYRWDVLIWILYDKEYQIMEAWSWERDAYINAFHDIIRLSPHHYRHGTSLLNQSPLKSGQDMHFVEKLGLQTMLDGETSTWESGFWSVVPDLARKAIGENIYFHKSRFQPSYMGGQIISYRIAKEAKWKGKIAFSFRRTGDHEGVAWPAR